MGTQARLEKLTKPHSAKAKAFGGFGRGGFWMGGFGLGGEGLFGGDWSLQGGLGGWSEWVLAGGDLAGEVWLAGGPWLEVGWLEGFGWLGGRGSG